MHQGWYNKPMAFTIFFSWWYGPGWKNAFVTITKRVENLAAELSMGILIKTLFEPWKQITSYSRPNSTIDVKIQIAIDNVFARMVGFVVRSSVLLFGLISCSLVFLFGIVLAIFWPIVPMLPVLLIMLSVVTK
jgi:hypothetical protein